MKLDEHLIRKLMALPESGMGYQRVDLRLVDGSELRNVLVFNAEEVELPASASNIDIADVNIHER